MRERVRRAAIVIADNEIGLQPRDLRKGGVLEHPGWNVLAEIAHAFFGQIQQRPLPLWHGFLRSVVAGASPPRRDEIDFGLGRCRIVGKASREHGCEKRTPGDFADALRAEQQPAQIGLFFRKDLSFLVRKAANRNIADTGSPIEACREPCAIGLKSLIA